eukprot:1161204-Pelagomonas_calceolata.AAC.5
MAIGLHHRVCCSRTTMNPALSYSLATNHATRLLTQSRHTGIDEALAGLLVMEPSLNACGASGWHSFSLLFSHRSAHNNALPEGVS